MKKTNRLNQKRSERKKVLLKSGAYLIVTDAEKIEKYYFEGIKNHIPDSLKNDLQIKIYSNKALSKIIDFAAEERNKDERFRDIWLVFDRDEVKNFDKLIEDAKESKMNVAWSNPCFEIWLLLHIEGLEKYSEKDKERLSKNRKCEGGKTFLKKRLSELLGGYNEAKYDACILIPTISDAIERAKVLDNCPKDRWPQKVGTRAYLLVESIMNL